MKLNRYLEILTLLLFLSIINLNSQQVVVSEFNNAISPNDEWIELLVVQDMVSLTSYTLRSCSITGEYPDIWQGGITFTDNLLWRNIRAGTVIVILNRGSQEIDVDKNDGYIELGAENTTYFSKNDYNGQWSDKALSIDSKGDIVELLNASGNHEHSLSFMNVIGGNYSGVSSPKLNLQDTLPIGESISVYPGKNINDYSGGNISSKVTVSKNDIYKTKGTPNKKTNSVDDNLNYWQTLRAPKWDNPSLGINVLPNEIDLYWDIASDSNPTDNTQGYLIVRVLQSQMAEFVEPKNGTTYKKGDSLGSAIVVDNFFNSLSHGYGDVFQLKCGLSYVYRVYAFRYAQDDVLGNRIAPSYGRGRTYNLQNYAEASIRKTKPAKPVIQTDNNIFQFCSGDSLKLTAFAYGGPYSYQWYLDGNAISGAKKKIYYAKTGGLYRIVIKNEKNCTNESDEVEIKEMPSPQARLSTNQGEIRQDTTMILCDGESYTFVANGGNRYEWFKNNVKISHASPTYIVDSGGLYYAVAINNGMECTDTTVRVFVKLLNVDFALEKDTLFYYLDKNTAFEDKSLNINNFSYDSLTFTNIIIPPGGIFSVSAESPSNIVLPKQSKVYTVRFEPTHSGKYLDSIIFRLPCQNSERKLYLVAYKEPMDVQLAPNTLKFDSLLNCDTEAKKITITIENKENHSIELLNPIISYPFSYEGLTFPYTLDSNSKVELTIKFYSSNRGVYNNNLQIPYQSGRIKDILQAELQGVVSEVSYSILKDSNEITEINFPKLIGCDDSSKVSISLQNGGDVPITITQNSNNPEISIEQLPIKLQSNESKQINVYFIPNKNGSYLDTLNLVSDLCQVKKSIILKGSKDGIAFAFSKKTVNFDTLIQCQNANPVYDTLSINFSGITQDSVYIKKIYGFKTPFFSHNLKEGQYLNETNLFTIGFDSAPLGEYFDTLSLLLMPCNIIKTLPVYALRTNPVITLLSDTVDFGEIEINTNSIDSLQISNSGLIPITISGFSPIQLPFSFSVSNEQFPLIIQPDSTKYFYFNYSPVDIGTHQKSVIMHLSLPCEKDTMIYLKGQSREPRELKTLIIIPDNISAEVGKEFDIPIIIRSNDQRSLADAKINSMTINIRYNPTLIFPKSIKQGDALSEADLSETKFIEEPPGHLKLSADVGKPANIKDGVFFRLHCLALLGNELSSEIQFDSLNFDSEIQIIPDTSSGLFTIYGDCNLSDRLISYDSNLNLLLTSSNPVSSNLTISFKTKYDSFLDLKLYNSLGQTIKTLVNEYKKSGKYTIDYDAMRLSPGYYYAVLRANSDFKVLKIIVVK